MKRVYFTILSFCTAFSSFATEDPTKSKNVVSVENKKVIIAETQKEENPFKFTGFVDTYYFANINKVMTNEGASGFERVFDRNANSFQLGMAQMRGTYTKGRTEAVVGLTFGNHGDLGNYGDYSSPLGQGITSTALAIKQAYVGFKVNDKLTLTAGQFITHIGYEIIDAPVNYNYSLSNLFANGPFYHTGIKAAYTINDKVSIMGGVVDGLDSKDDNNKGKGIIGQVTMKPNSKATLYLNYFRSDEGIAAKSIYNLYDAVLNYQVNDKYYFGLNAAFGQQSAKNWGGVAAYSNYAINSKLSIGGRYEYFNNKSGIRSLLNAQENGTNVQSITLTINYKVTDNLLFKPELRSDSYLKGSNQFTDSKGNAKDSQMTIGAAAMFYF